MTAIMGRGLLVLLALGLLVLLLLALLSVQLPAELPALRNLEPCAHVFEEHGEAGRRAIDELNACGSAALRVQLCPPTGAYGLTVVVWCEPAGSTVCPGAYLTIAGRVKTAFFRPCSQWRECK